MTDNTNPAPGIEIIHNQNATAFSPQPHAVVRDSTGILATAKTRTGNLVTGELTSQDRVTVKGVEMTLAQAEAKGFITRGVDGRYQDASLAEVEQRVAKHLEPERVEEDLSEALEVDTVYTETLADWAGAVRSIGGNPAAVLGEVVLNPDKVPEALSMLARQHGINSSKMKADIQAISASVEDGINRYVATVGVRDPNAFWDYVHRTVPKMELVVAVNRALFEGNASSFKELAGRYLRSAGGGAVSGNAPKSVKVRVGGTIIETDPTTARRNGWI